MALLYGKSWVIPAGILLVVGITVQWLWRGEDSPQQAYIDDNPSDININRNTDDSLHVNIDDVSVDSGADADVNRLTMSSQKRSSWSSDKTANETEFNGIKRQRKISNDASRDRLEQDSSADNDITNNNQTGERSSTQSGSIFIANTSTSLESAAINPSKDIIPSIDIIPGIEEMDAETALGEVRDLILNDGPSGFLALMGAQQVKRDGSAVGYSIQPPEGVYLDSLGVLPGDIIMEVNGVALTNPDTVDDIILNLLVSSEVVLKLERDGVVETVKR